MLRRPHIAVIAPPWYPVPPVGYGGIELVVHLLVQSLRRQGVRVTLYGCEGSAPGTTVMAPAGWASALSEPWYMPEMRYAHYNARVFDHLGQLEDVDVIHDNSGWMSAITAAFAGHAPVIQTVHGPMMDQRIDVYEALGSRLNLVAISESQRRAAPALNWAGVVHNAVDMDDLRVGSRHEKEAYLLCLARVSPEKGQHRAIEVASRSGRRLILAGKVGETDDEQHYFRNHIEPHIDGDRVIHMSNVAGEQKRELLARAGALIHPVEWAEPFGLAIVEAMASGTPCVGIGLGAVPELVIDGLTGFLADDVDGLVEGIRRIGEIDNHACARSARGRFHPDVMASRYRAIYERLMDGFDTRPAAPTVLDLPRRVALTGSKVAVTQRIESLQSSPLPNLLPRGPGPAG